MTRLELHQAERIATLTEALEKVWDAFDGGPDHPWIPGFNAAPIYPVVAAALQKPEPGLVILGYKKDGKPIHPIKPGMMATAAVVICCGCHTAIRGMGGPIQGALCLTCWGQK